MLQYGPGLAMKVNRAWALVVAAGCALQAAGPRTLPDGYTRRVWQTQDGLPENTIQAFAQTPDNYLWIGASGGLVRFDGASFVLFDRDNTPAIRENSVFSLTTGRDGSLWAGTDGAGLVRYRRGVFRAYSKAQGLANDFVRVVYESRDGTLWAGTDDGLFRLEGDRLARVDNRGRIPALAVHAIREDSAGNLWVGGSTMLRIRGEECREFHLEGAGSAARVKSILETADGAIWAGTVSGLQRFTRASGRFDRVPGISSTVRALVADAAGTLWVGSIGDGLLRYSAGSFTRVAAADGLPSATILSLFIDNEQNIWAGMQTGLMRLSRTAMSTFPLPEAANADFGTIYTDRDGSLWVASTHLYRISPHRDGVRMAPPPMEGTRVRSVYRDRSGALWTGTEGNGVFRAGHGPPKHYTKANGLVNDFVRALLEGRDGSMWIGTDEGITRLHDGVLTNYREPQGLAYFSVRALLEDRAGDIWIGTERGVSHWRDGVFLRDEATTRLRDEKIWALHEDGDGGLWLGARGGGLFRWRDGRLASLSTAQGLAANSIYKILEDQRGTFWMSGPNGISAVSRAGLDHAIAQPGFRPAVTLYGLSDGVEATQIHGGVSPAGALTPNGEIWFPSNRGPVRISPPDAWPEFLPRVAVEQVLADGREVPLSGRLVIPPGQGKLQIDYSAVRLRSQERIRFRYILEGFEHEWNEALRRRAAYYTNVPPGDYRFRVQAFEMNQPEQVTEASVEIKWSPHFYRTAWFLALVAGGALAAVLGAWRLRLRQVHTRYLAVLGERNRVAREMHDTVIQGCVSVSALLEAVASIGPPAPGASRDLLDTARTQVRATADEARRAVWNLRQTGASPDIGRLLDEMAAQVSHSSRVPVLVERSGQARPLDPAVEHDILMVAREAVYNAIRHAQPAEVRIRVHFEDERMRMSVLDNGIGFDTAQASACNDGHFGLVGMRERAERLGGRFDVRSAPGAGTELMVEVPVRSAAAEKLGIDLHP
jgi:ligand-binding sensor domain-containing protein/signal transduction histidine kinase